MATLPAPVLASGTIGVGWVGRGRGRGASASGSSCVASQGRHHRMSWSWKGSAVGPSRRYGRRQELLPLLGAPGCGRGSRRRRLTPAVRDRAVARVGGGEPGAVLAGAREGARELASAGARAGFPDLVWRDHVWRLGLGFVNQKSTAPAGLSRFFGERNGRKPHRMTAFRPSGATCDVISGASRFRASFCRSQATEFCGATEFARPSPSAGRPISAEGGGHAEIKPAATLRSG